MKLFLTCLLIPGAFAFAGSDSTAVASKDEPIDAAKLWAHACQQCHNLQPATRFSDAQWEVIVHHMRVRASLTGAEQRAITQFLKEAN
ncbi:MAG: cytochrome c [Verrucomicrobiota bacterium]